RELILNFQGTEVGRMSMDFLHDGLPETVREAVWKPTASRRVLAAGPHQSENPNQPATGASRPDAHTSNQDPLLALPAHPNIASKSWIIRQYDHEVQGCTVIKPIVNENHEEQREGPSDAAVVTPVLGSSRGLAIANGLATGLRDDPYLMTLAAIDECVRNL